MLSLNWEKFQSIKLILQLKVSVNLKNLEPVTAYAKNDL